jgi:hypothetical protein
LREERGAKPFLVITVAEETVRGIVVGATSATLTASRKGAGFGVAMTGSEGNAPGYSYWTDILRAGVQN